MEIHVNANSDYLEKRTVQKTVGANWLASERASGRSRLVDYLYPKYIQYINMNYH